MNAEAEDDDELNEEEQAARRLLRDNLHASTTGVVLDWDEETDDNAQYQVCFSFCFSEIHFDTSAHLFAPFASPV